MLYVCFGSFLFLAFLVLALCTTDKIAVLEMFCLGDDIPDSSALGLKIICFVAVAVFL